MTHSLAFIGTGFKPSGPNKNVINLMRLFLENKDDIKLYIRTNDYEPDSRKLRIDKNIHHGYKFQFSEIEVVGVIAHLERFNFSIRCLKSIMVLNEKTNEFEHRKIFRQYNIIRDGKLAIDKLYAKLSRNMFDLLTSAGLLVDQKGNRINIKYGCDYIYTIDLTSLPLVSLNWAQPNRLKLYDLMKREARGIECIKYARSILKYYKQLNLVDDNMKDNNSEIYDEEPDEVVEINRELHKVNCIVYRIPQFNKIKLTDDDRRYIFSLCKSYVQTREYIRKWTRVLNNIRFKIRCIIFAIEWSKKKGSYQWSELKRLPRSKNKMYQETVIKYGNNDIVMQRLVYTKIV